MSSNSRFVPPASKAGKSSAGSGGPQASKRISGLPTQAGAGAGGGGGGGASSKNNVQVIHGGRIVTPQSLLLKKSGFVKPPDIPEYYIAAPKPREFMAISETATSTSIASGALPSIGDKLSVAAALSKKQTNMPGSKRALAAKGARAGAQVEEKAMTEEMVYVSLCETPTEIVFSLKSFVVANESRDATLAEEKNALYDANVEKHKNKDAFASRPAQTVNNPLKNQNEMATPNSTAEMGCSAFSYEIKDAMDSLNNTADQAAAGFVSAGSGVSEREKIAELTGFVHQSIVDTVTVASITPGCLLDTAEIHRPVAPQERRGATKKPHESTKKSVNAMASTADTSNSTPHNNSGTTLNTGAGGVDKDSGSESKEFGTTPTESKASLGQQSQSDAGMSSHADDFSRVGGRQKDDEPVRAIDSAAVLRRKRADEILGSKSILKKLHMLERAVQQNAYRDNMLLYRDTPKVESLTFASAASNQANENANSLFGGGLGSRFGNLLSSAVLGGDESADANAAEPTAEEEVDDASRKVQKLFTYFSSELSKGRTVTSMAWSAINPDLLAVGYGKYVHDPSLQEAMKTVTSAEQASGGSIANLSAAVAQANEMSGAVGDQAIVAPVLNEVDPSLLQPSCESEENGGGLVLFWSLRNPDYPEKFFHTPYPVTALDFSSVSPAILAVGMYSGDVAIYDVRRDHDWGKPLESAEGITGGHSEPVWQLKWLVKGQERVETLVSISTDGNVLEWSFKKGIIVTMLMQLQRTGVGEGWISRQAAGMCFDFCPSDPTVYVAGSEEGQIHKCSVSYSEQYLDTFEPHCGPVYKLKFSPHYPNVFLSCSADWSIGLYDLQKRPPIVNMHSTGQDFSVNDICWCPGNSTVFAAVTSDAKLQIWDLSVSNIDPVVVLDTAKDFAESPGGIIERNFKDAVQGALTTVAQINTAYSTLQRKAGIGAALRKANMNGNKNASEEDKDKDANAEGSHVAKLVKNLSTGPGPRVLTTVLFGVKSPVIAVGDNRGTVIVYRIIEPVTVSHEPAAVQTAKLQRALGQKGAGAEAAGTETSATATGANAGDGSVASPGPEEVASFAEEEMQTAFMEEDEVSMVSNN